MNLLLVPITLGFLGSFHCVGMCGPIALALPLNRESLLTRTKGILLYNLGRVSVYALFGGLFGLVGQSIVIAGYQQTLSITLGVALLIMVLLPSSIFARIKITHFIYSGIAKLKGKLALLFTKNSNSSLFFIGTLNGMLPCGLLYMGIAGAIATGSSLNGALFMAMFGLGTLPAMISLSFIGNKISISFRNKIRKAVPAFVVMMAFMLILRGMNLGIPYVSPEMSATKPVCHKCCHK